jgi:hypothetical protein
MRGSVRQDILGNEEGGIMPAHNDPNAVNSIFSDIDNLYDIFGFPGGGDGSGIEKVVIALTFAAVPQPRSSSESSLQLSAQTSSRRFASFTSSRAAWSLQDTGKNGP